MKMLLQLLYEYDITNTYQLSSKSQRVDCSGAVLNCICCLLPFACCLLPVVAVVELWNCGMTGVIRQASNNFLLSWSSQR